MKFQLREWMKCLGLVCALTCALLFAGCGERTKSPGEAEFEAANDQINTNRNGAAFGDTPETVAAAGAFSASFKKMQAMMFSGGSGKSFASGGEFVTTVVQRPGVVIVLCHVPELRNYKTDDVRTSLAELAWMLAQAATAKLPGVDANTKLMVGLRGFASYGPIWEGKIEGDASVKSDDIGGRKRFYPYFASPQTASTKAKEGGQS